MTLKLSSPKFLTTKEYDRMLAFCKRTPTTAATFILLALHTGARTQELLDLKPSNFFVTDKGPVVYIIAVKGSNNREIPIPKWLYTRVLKLPKKQSYEGNKVTQGRQDYIFPYSRAWVRDFWIKFRPPGKGGIHCTRHTFALRLYQAERDVLMVQYALGHKSLSNTQVYVRFLKGAHGLRRALGKMRMV